MKQLGAFVILLALLSLGPAAFAADGDVPAPSPGASPRAGTEASPPPRYTDQDWHGGELRQPGAYMGQDGVLHHIPALQDPRLKIN
jgi:hypothetical protein